MRVSVLLLLLAVFALPCYSQAPASTPMMTSVEPDFGKAGETLTAHGTNLGQDCVSTLYLTDGTTDLKLLIVDQSDALIRFKIPLEAKPGRFALMVLTKTKPPKLIEQPVKITVAPETTASRFLPGMKQFRM